MNIWNEWIEIIFSFIFFGGYYYFVIRKEEHMIKYCVIGILYSIYLAGMLHFTLLHRVILDTRHIKFFSLNTGVSIYDMSETFHNILYLSQWGF